MAARVFGVLILMFVMTRAVAQENPTMVHRFQLKANGNVPHSIANKAFRRTFIGVYDMSLALRYRLFSGFSAGIMGMNSLWRIPDNKIPGLNTVGQMNGGGLSISYDYPTGEVGVLYATLNAGVAEMHFYGLSYDSIPPNFQKRFHFNYGELELGAYFFTEGNFAIGMQTSFVFTSFGFDPYPLALNQHKAYLDSDLKGNLVTFNLGFSVVYCFLEKKGT